MLLGSIIKETCQSAKIQVLWLLIRHCSQELKGHILFLCFFCNEIFSVFYVCSLIYHWCRSRKHCVNIRDKAVWKEEGEDKSATQRTDKQTTAPLHSSRATWHCVVCYGSMQHPLSLLLALTACLRVLLLLWADSVKEGMGLAAGSC